MKPTRTRRFPSGAILCALLAFTIATITPVIAR